MKQAREVAVFFKEEFHKVARDLETLNDPFGSLEKSRKEQEEKKKPPALLPNRGDGAGRPDKTDPPQTPSDPH